MKINFNHTALQGEILLPASKSISNRALIIQAICKKECIINNLSDANDTILLKNLLDKINRQEEEIIIDVEDAGTACRFLTSLLAIQHNKKFILKGTERMHLRPIGDLVDALVSLGANIEYIEETGFLPLKIIGTNIQGGDVHIQTTISSQFISSLCLIAPVLPLGLNIHFLSEVVSESYVEMTLNVMQKFGIAYISDKQHISIPPQEYRPQRITIENDWSSACFFYCMTFLKKEVLFYFPFLQKESIQGDAYIAKIAEQFGIESIQNEDGILLKKSNSLHSIPASLDLSHYPDLAIPFIVCCAISYPTILIRGLHHLEYKESERLTALTIELLKIGVELIYQNDELRFVQLEHFGQNTTVSFSTYNDHRISMALSIVSILGIDVTLDDSQCVQKSFPTFWKELEKIGFLFT